MDVKPKRKPALENGDNTLSAEDSVLGTLIGNGEDVGPLVRHAFETGRPESLLHQLKHVVKKKEAEIEELCKTHYEEFIRAVDELRGVLVDAEELKGELSGDNLRLQDVGTALLTKLEELLESYATKKNVAEAVDTSKNIVRVLELCAKCNSHVAKGRFYPALKTLEAIETSYEASVPVAALRAVVGRSIPEIKSHIEKRACGEFNEWLVQIRGSARVLGQTAIGRAASARQRDEEVLERQRRTEERNLSEDFEYGLDVDEVSEDDSSVLWVDLTPVYRAHHIHACLGIPERFQDYYFRNRMLQLNSDLQISSSQPFVESYQMFLAQIAGFFIVEDRVLRTARGLLTPDQNETMWETALSKMTSVLGDQFSSMDSTTHLLLVKDYVTLLASTLKPYGYEVAPLLEVLDAGREKYHKLLLDECRAQIAAAMTHDTYQQMVLKKEADYDASVASFGLVTLDMLPAFPYVASFSSAVPDSCQVVRAFVKGSVDYLSYGVNASFYDVVKRYLDRLLVEVLNEALLDTIRGGAIGVSQAMQVASNIAALERVCDFFLRTAAQLCGIPTRSAERQPSLAAKSVLRATRDEAHLALLALVNAKLDEFMSLSENVNWTAEESLPPDEEDRHGNDYINEVVIYLDAVLTTAHHILAPEALFGLADGALNHVSSSVVAAFLSDSVKRFSLGAVAGIADDLRILGSFAEEQLRGLGFDGVGLGGLAEARQLTSLLMSGQPENFMNPVIREKNYSALDYKKVSVVIEKFRDAPDGIFGSLATRGTKQSARKKSMDALRKRLKELN